MTDFDSIGIECYRCGNTDGFKIEGLSHNGLQVTCSDCGNVDVWEG